MCKPNEWLCAFLLILSTQLLVEVAVASETKAAEELYLRSESVLTILKHHVTISPEIAQLSSAEDPEEKWESVYSIRVWNRDETAQKPHALKVAMVCGQHGNEPITVDVCLQALDRVLYDRKLRREILFGNLRLLFVPLANPGGTNEALELRNCKRTNRKGVDLNRNFPKIQHTTKWSSGSGDVNPGPHPLSEYESEFIVSEIEALGCPDLFVNVHSGGRMILWPYDSRFSLPRNNEVFKTIAMVLAVDHCQDCQIGNGIRALYSAIGTLNDHVQEQCNPHANLVWEVYQDWSTSPDRSKSCFEHFNPTSHEEIDKVSSEWAEAFVTALTHAWVVKKHGSEAYLSMLPHGKK